MSTVTDERSLLPRGSELGPNWDGVDTATNQTVDQAPKDGKLAWIVCTAGFLLQVLIVGMLHVFGVFFVEFIKEFDKTKGEVAWVGSAAYGLSMAFGPVTGLLVNRYGNRPVTMAGCLICALSALLSSFAGDISTLFLSYSFLYGIGTSFAYTPTMTIAQDYFDKYVSIATGIMTAGSSTGTLILAPLTQYIVDRHGWRVAFRFFAGTCLFTVLCAAMFKPISHKKVHPVQRMRRSPLRLLMQELSLWKDRVFIVWVLGISFVMFGYYIPYVHLVSYAIDVGVSPDQGSMLVMCLGGATATGRIMFGKIVQYGFLNRLHMHQLSMVITGTAAMMLPLITSFGGLLTYVICVGLVDGCFVVLLPLMTATLVGSDKTVVAWGFLVGAASITFTLGPPVAGWIYDSTGSYKVAFHIAGVPIIVGALILFLIPWAQRTSTKSNILEMVNVPSPTKLLTEQQYATQEMGAPNNIHPNQFLSDRVRLRCGQTSSSTLCSTKDVSLTMTHALSDSYQRLEQSAVERDHDDDASPSSLNSKTGGLSGLKDSSFCVSSLPADLNMSPSGGKVTSRTQPDHLQTAAPMPATNPTSDTRRDLFLKQKQQVLCSGRARAQSWSQSGQTYRTMPQQPGTTFSDHYDDLMSFEPRYALHAASQPTRVGSAGVVNHQTGSSGQFQHYSTASPISHRRHHTDSFPQQPSGVSLESLFDSFGMSLYGPSALSQTRQQCQHCQTSCGAAPQFSAPLINPCETNNRSSGNLGISSPSDGTSSPISSPIAQHSSIIFQSQAVPSVQSPEPNPSRVSSPPNIPSSTSRAINSNSPTSSSHEKLPTIDELIPLQSAHSMEITNSLSTRNSELETDLFKYVEDE